MEHDALTGLLNRVQFRKAVRADRTAGAPRSRMPSSMSTARSASTLGSVNESNQRSGDHGALAFVEQCPGIEGG
jgi:hypothetical protein